MKDIKDLTFEEVEECRKLLNQMGEPVTPQNLAKELGVKKTDMMRFLLEGGYHFDMTEWTKHNKYYQVVKKWITVDKVFVNGALTYDSGTFTHAGTGRFLERGSGELHFG